MIDPDTERLLEQGKARRLATCEMIEAARAAKRSRAGADGADVRDGCEWCPAEDRPALETDEHHRTTPAAVMVGSNVEWRLCEECSALPRFARFRVRRPVRS